MSNRLGGWLRGGALAAGVLLSGVALALPAYSNVYVLGDSLADSGNNALFFDACCGGARTPTPISAPPVSDPVFIPTFPYAPSNTYSNGPVWTQYFAGSLGLSASPSLLGGPNYAFGGARVGPAGSPFPYSLTDQMNMFLARPGGGGLAPGSALYVVEGGGNDARDVLQAALGGATPLELAAMIATYADNVATILATLYLKGADQFLLWNIPDIGKIPAIVVKGALVSEAASDLVETMNDALQLALSSLPPDLIDGVYLFDAYGVFNDVVSNPGAYGFSNVTDACAASAACIADPTGYLFWDGIHPTTAGHRLLAQLSLAEIPEPETIILLTIGLLGVFVTRRRAA